jgi:hypothetical protein
VLVHISARGAASETSTPTVSAGLPCFSAASDQDQLMPPTKSFALFGGALCVIGERGEALGLAGAAVSSREASSSSALIANEAES